MVWEVCCGTLFDSFLVVPKLGKRVFHSHDYFEFLE